MADREAFPIIYVADVARSVAFYCELLGFEVGFRWPAEGELEFAALALGATSLGVGSNRGGVGTHGKRLGEPGLPQFELCIYVDDTDQAVERLLTAGAVQLKQAEDMPWGERLAYFEDPDGHVLHITSRIEN